MSAPEKLQVASPKACNTQQTPAESATARATTVQRQSLKALARKALARNNPCNESATTPAETVQQACNEAGSKVARSQPGVAAMRARLLALAAAEYRDSALVRALSESFLRDCESMGDDALRALLSMLSDDADRHAGRVPAGDTAVILCRHCGPVYVAPGIARVLPVVNGWPRALGCPWCLVKLPVWHRLPRPHVECVQCQHYQPDPLNPGQGMGRCGLHLPSGWPHEPRQCGRFDPKPNRTTP